MNFKPLLAFCLALSVGTELLAIQIPRVRSRYNFYNCETYETRCRDASGPPSSFCTAAENTCEDLRYIYQMVLVPNSTNKILVRAGQSPNISVYFSPDNGRTWAKTFNRVSYALAINYKGTALTADADDNIYESRNGGLDWRLISTLPGGGIRTIFFDKINPLKVYVAIQLTSVSDAASIYISEDGGRNFVPSPFNFSSEQWPVNVWIVWTIAQNKNNGTLYAGMEYEGGTLPDPYHAPLLRSVDGGETWENVYTEVRGHVIDIEIDEQNNRIFAHNEGFDLYTSIDDGESWEAALWPYTPTIALNEANPNGLFLGEWFYPECTAEGACVFDGHEMNRGRVWRMRVAEGSFEILNEEGGLHISDMDYQPANRTLYIATYGQGLHKIVIAE